MTPALAELVAVLMSWAVQLSGYPQPARLPEVELVGHQWLVEQACGGQGCKVQGWLPPGDRIYLDDALDPVGSTMDSSVLLHELVHYLQRESGRFGTDCSAAIDKEREAYATQRSFLAAYGRHAPMFIAVHGLACGSAGGTPPTPGAPVPGAIGHEQPVAALPAAPDPAAPDSAVPDSAAPDSAVPDSSAPGRAAP